jgi:hypothetical protein
MAPQFPWPIYFTPGQLHTLLRDKGVLKGSSKLPGSADPAFTYLATYLNILRWKVQGWTGPWPEYLKRLEKIGEAIWVLTEELPTQREHYAWVGDGLERAATEWRDAAAGLRADQIEAKEFQGRAAEECQRGATEARADLAAFDTLITAARAARDRGLPMIQDSMLVISRRCARWHDFARDLETAFHSAFKDQAKGCGLSVHCRRHARYHGRSPQF